MTLVYVCILSSSVSNSASLSIATSHPATPFSFEAFVGSPITPVSLISFVLKPQNTLGPVAFKPILVYFDAGNVS